MSWLGDYGFYCLSSNPGFVMMPGALLVDICALPVLAGLDVGTLGFNYVLKPIGQVISVAGIDLSKVLSVMGQAALFLAPLPILGGMGYLGYSLLSNRSIVEDGRFVLSSLSTAFEPVVTNKATLCAITVALGAGVAIGKAISGDSGKGHSRD